MKGYIMQLQDLSVNDGEGIRTIVFLAGCPLRCRWCANPEGQNRDNPFVHEVSSGEILDHIHQQDIFYQFSGGGITFSGGEATSQTEFLDELSGTLCEEGYNLALETCGQFSYEKTEPILKRMSQIFMDIKHADSGKHRIFTGAGNEQILENICRTYEMCMARVREDGTDMGNGTVPGMVIRIPVIVGVNGNDQDLGDIFSFISRNIPLAGLELLPYHRYGEDKYRKLGRPLPDSAFQIPSDEDMKRWRKMAAGMGIRIVSYR